MIYSNVGTGVPVGYDYMNLANAAVDPSTVHVSNTGLNNFFRRYLLQKAMSVFEWKIPEGWSKDYMLYCLYCWGFFAIINTDKFGVIPQGCSLKGYDVFYRPTHAVITNPLLNGIKEPQIDVQCALIKLQPDYGGIYDLVSYYSNMLALTAEAAGVNLVNSKLPVVFRAGNKQQAESFKKMYDAIASGQPAVFIDKSLLDEGKAPAWDVFCQSLKENYLVSDLLSDLRKIEQMFDTEIGIPNANTDKRERLISDEVNANNFETRSKCELWLEELKKGVNKANSMFGLNLSVDWRKTLEMDDLGGGMDANK